MLPTVYSPLSDDPVKSHRWRGVLTVNKRNVFLTSAMVFFLWWLGYTYVQQHGLGPKLALGEDQAPLFPPQPPEDAVNWGHRAEQVKQAFLHAYKHYEEYASPMDELLPLSNGSVDNFNGWGVTMVDSLDTMYLMGLHEEFERGVMLVSNISFAGNNYTYAPFFETTIRYLGGLLSAYGLSHDLTLLEKADELGRGLINVFNTTSGYPVFSVNPATGETMESGWQTGWLAEIGTCQMEYKYLAKLTGKKQYFDVAQKIMTHLHKANTTSTGGMFPTMFNLTSGEPTNQHVSIGAMADSAYEYLLKQWLLTSKTEAESLEMYVQQATAVINNLLYLSPKRNLLYVTDVYVGENVTMLPSRKFEHLSCFLPGLLALGAHTLPDHVMPPPMRELHKQAAKGLAYSCWLMYADQATGLGPEEVTFYSAWQVESDRNAKIMRTRTTEATATNTALGHPPQQQIQVNETQFMEDLRWSNAMQRWREKGSVGTPPGLAEQPPVSLGSDERDYQVNNVMYILRPETIESFYIMWRTTGDVAWRERGWAAFQALEREARVPSGFASLVSVEYSPSMKKNEMPSFFLAETLKYLYLLFAEEDLVPLNQYVFNTEAHPLPVFEWTHWERQKYGIP